MIRSRARQPPSEAADQTSCDREPIHIPGHIQPHGVLIATAPGERRITHVSENTGLSLGLPATSLLGTDLADLVGSGGMDALEEALRDSSYAPSNVLDLSLPIPVRPRRGILVHHHQERIIVEFEDIQWQERLGAGLSKAQGIISSLRRAHTVGQLCDQAAQEFRQLTGFDRVMVYRFDPAGHGSVIAEDKAAGLKPYLHLHYPASDIPQQARRLYILQRVRSIPDANYQPIPLISADGSTLDMSFCALRGISPIHLEYMRNMGTRASFSVSLLRERALWGMIVGHHTKPLNPSASVRALCDVIGQLFSLLLQRVEETEALAGRLARNSTILTLRDEIDSAESLFDGLHAQSNAMLDLMSAGGALIRSGGQTRLIGNTPPPEACDEIAAALMPLDGDSITARADIGIQGGVASAYSDTASGVLVMPIAGSPGDVIAWFRPEVARTIRWAGDPAKPVTQTEEGARLSPRKSFEIWTELQRGRSAPWTEIDVHAADDLRRGIMQSLLHRAVSQLAHLSAFDPLTGLANRRTIEAHLKRWHLEGAPETGSLLFLDLDRFKAINDTLGHEAGDQFLATVAERLRKLCPPGAIAARMGGDEFIIFWPDSSCDEATRFAGTLAEELARPLQIHGSFYYSGASIGVVSADASALDSMMWQVDAAMYAAKHQGGGQFVLYDPTLHTGVLGNTKLEQDLFLALDRKEFTVHYQPIVSLFDGRIAGFEALARWHHPERGWIPPSDFIPLAEKAGMISRIGLIILNEAVKCLSKWQTTHPALSMSVNVSARQLMDRSLMNSLPGILARTKLTPGSLCLEVTESTLMETAAIRTLTHLRGLGIKVAVDDFGTGHSSLAYLRKLPVDSVKLDRSFVAPLGTAQADRFFAAIIDLARTLNLRTVAEGCETWDQWKVLDMAGCDMVQGWLIAKAMDAASAEHFLSANPRWKSADPVMGMPSTALRTLEFARDGDADFRRGRRITIEGDGLQG